MTDFVIPKDLRVRGLVAAAALLIAAACGGDDEVGAAATPVRTDSAAAPAGPNAAVPSAAPQPALPGAQPNSSAMDNPMTPAQAAEAATSTTAPQGPVTTQAIDNYRLSIPKLRALVQAGQNIGALQARRPELRDSMRIPTMDPNLLYQKLNSIADAREAVNRAGITPEEYAIATSALIQATVVHEMRRRGQTPQGHFNEANAKFVADNWEEIQTMMRNAGGGPPAGQRPN